METDLFIVGWAPKALETLKRTFITSYSISEITGCRLDCNSHSCCRYSCRIQYSCQIKKKSHTESSVLFHSSCEKVCRIVQKALKWFHHQRLAQIWAPLNFHCSRLFQCFMFATTHSWGIDRPVHGSNHSQNKGVEKWHLIVCCQLIHYIN